jgi:DNA-binding MarR family transcriptional regulator
MPSTPEQPQLDAAKALMRARTAIVERVEQALAADDLPPMSWYDVLCALDEAEDRSLRPRDLAFAVAHTRSGLTRLLDRIHAAGLVERKECPSDRRGHLVALTPSGSKTLDLMRPVYARALQEGFVSLMSEAEARRLSELLDRVTTSACSAVGDDDEPPAPVRRAA